MHEVVEGLWFDPRTRVRGELHFCKDVLGERERGEETERREREESKIEREREGGRGGLTGHEYTILGYLALSDD